MQLQVGKKYRSNANEVWTVHDTGINDRAGEETYICWANLALHQPRTWREFHRDGKGLDGNRMLLPNTVARTGYTVRRMIHDGTSRIGLCGAVFSTEESAVQWAKELHGVGYLPGSVWHVQKLYWDDEVEIA